MIRIFNVNHRERAREAASQLLERAGFDVVSFDNGGGALAAARDDIALAMLDVALPDVDVYETCRRLKANPATANVVVLLTSATPVCSQDKVAGFDAGADGYLVEPVDGPELLATIRALLRARGGERRAQTLATELQFAVTVRDEFLAMLGHELRNPIGAITTALHLLDAHPDTAALERYLPVLNRQTRVLGRLVDDLLDVARVTSGKVSIEHKPVDLRECVERSVQALCEDLVGVPPKVSLAVSGPALRVTGDAVRLEQIIGNLLSNAIKYTPAGGHVEVRLAEVEGQARLEVQDDGIGMDPATCDRVFDLFVQGKQGLDRSRGGLGLGLTVVRRLVELHGGAIHAKSPGEGRGSTFIMTLPLTVTEQPATPTTRSKREGGGLNLAVIEDNDDAREALADVLTLRGHKVETAADGEAGLALVLRMKPDIVLLDIGLPLCDGYTVAREIHAQFDGHAPRLIAMTGYGQPEDRQRALDAGFDVHLVKPLSMPLLDAVLKDLRARPRAV